MNIENLGLVAMYEPALHDLRVAMLSGVRPDESAGPQKDRDESKWCGSRTTDSGLGIISISGSLGYGWWGPSYQGIAARIEEMESSSNVEKIILDINSPGGVISGLIELAEMIGKCKKPVYAYCEGLCASAAYLLASAARKIYTTPQTAIGSIGIIVSYLDDTKAMDRMGYEEIVFRSQNAKKKNLDPRSDEGKAEIEKSINEIEALFIAKIADNRGVSSDDVIAKFGQGLTFHADEAKGLGMVDEIVSDFDACVKKIMPSLIGGGGVVMGATNVELTIDLLKAEHPDWVNQITEEGRVAGFESGKQDGIANERKRIAGLSALKAVEFGAEIVELAITNGDSVEMAKSAILDKQIAAAKGGVAKPAKTVSLSDIAAESSESEVNPVASLVPAADSQVSQAVSNACGAIDAQLKKRANKKE